MGNGFTDFLTKGFVGIGELFSKNVPQAFQTFQNSISPNASPQNTDTFSFDFSGSFQKLLDSFKPQPAQQAIGGLTNSALDILDAFKNKIIDNINNSNRRPESVNTSIPTAPNPQPSQNSFSLGELFSLFSQASPSISASPESAAIAAGQNTGISTAVLLAGVGIVTVVLLTRSK
jgi:hypothetical protein